MAEDLESVAAPPWAKQAKPDLEPVEAPSWAKKPDRGVLERAGEAMGATAQAAWEAAKKPFTREDVKTPGEALKRALPGGESLAAAISPVTATLGAVGAGGESLVASGLAGAKRLFPGATKTSEELYQESLPEAGQVLSALGAGRVKAPGFVGPTRFAAEPEYAAARTVTKPGTSEEAAAGRALETAAKDPEAVRRALATEPREIVPGSKPTTFQLTQDVGLGQLERASARGTEAETFKEIEQQQNAARQRALEGIQTAGSPAEVADHLRIALAGEESAATRAVEQAQQRAWEAAQRPGGTYDPTTYGNIFRRELQQAEEAARANERRLWQAVDPDGTLQANPQPVQELERGVYGTMTEAGAASITPAERQISQLIQGYRPVISFRELTDLRSLTSTALREELVTRGQTPAYARLSRLRQGIEDAVGRSFDEAGQATGAPERLRAASAATRERAETFRPLRDVTRREGVQGPYRMGEAAVPGRVVQPGPKGYDSVSAYLRAVGNERGLPELQDAVAANMRNKVIGADGTVDPKKLDVWMRQNEGSLRAISERDGGAFVQTLRDAGQARQVVAQAQARQAAVAAQRESAAVKGLLGATDDAQVVRVVGDIFGRAGPRADAAARMRELVGRVRANPEALAGLRRAVIDHIRETFTSNAPAGTDNMLRAEQFQNFLKGTRLAALREVLEPDQVTTLQNVAADIRRMNTSVATKIRGGSDTAQNLAAMNWKAELAIAAGEFALEHTLMGLMPPVVSIARWALKGAKQLRAGRQAARAVRVDQLVDRAMADPDFAQQLLGQVTQTRQRGPTAPIAAGAIDVGQAQAQPAPRQAGGGVPAIGGTGGRYPGAGEASRPRAPRQRPSQALQDGGEARAQAGPTIKPGTREHWGALLASSTGSGPISSGAPRGKPLAAVSRNDIVEMLRRRGLSGEALGSFKDYSPESYQEGGDVEQQEAPEDKAGGFEAAAARVQRRYPTREPDPRALAASQGKVTFGDVARQKAEDIADIVTTPGRAYKEGLTPEEEVGWAGKTAGYLTGRGVTSPGPGIGIFGGIGAKTANRAMLEKAQGMHAAGADPASIWNQTGWYRGAEGKWRFEIPDVEARLKELDPEQLARAQESGSAHRFSPDLSQVVEHPEFFRAYPAMKQITGELITDPRSKQRLYGFFQPPHEVVPGSGIIEPPYLHAVARESSPLLSGTLHEMQHGVQHLEQFAPGSSPALAAKVIGPTGLRHAARIAAEEEGLNYDLLSPPGRKQFDRQAEAMAYAAHAGEVEARNVQERWEKGIRQLPPWRTEDVPRENQIIPTGQPRKRFIRGEPVGETTEERLARRYPTLMGKRQEGGAVDEPSPTSPLPDSVKEAWGDPFERAAYRQARAVRPRSFTQQGRTEGPFTQALEKAGESVIPQSPSDYALMAVGGPWGRAGKVAAVGLAALLESASPAEAGKIKTLMELGVNPDVVRRILSGTKREGGGSFALSGGAGPSEGSRMMGVLPNERNIVTPEGEPLNRKQLEDYIRTNLSALQREGRYLGTWRDPETGKTYVDVSQRFGPEQVRTATKFGERTGQLAGYQIGTGSFPVGNWREFIASPEFHQRMREMAEAGHEYLRDKPTREWWSPDPFERVYGPQRLPQAAGFTAATAPNAAPRENLQTMSEYMRRVIRGEPVIQPEWRVPEGAMTRVPGSQIGMEASRIPNLLRAERGAIDELQRMKVREEGLALMRDPDAVVLDRHWARLAEDPERGIFANAQEGVVSSVPTKEGSDYIRLKGEVVNEARAQKMDPRDFSADVWTGIRETIKRTSELYGQRHRGSAISGESMSYADHFDQLLDEKAKHLGITLQKMEQRLRNGDGNLLSYLLATTPAAYEAYRQWQAPSGPTAPASSDRNQPTRIGL